MYDLLLKNGTVFGSGLPSGVLDVALGDGLVQTVAARLDTSAAKHVIDVSDCLVTPGLVDVHAHVYPGGTPMGAHPDHICPPSTVCTVVDAGSSGSANFAGLYDWIISHARTRTLCYVNLSRIGLAGIDGGGELVNGTYADPEGALRMLREHDEAVGVKLRLSRQVMGGSCLTSLRLAKEVADEANKPLHVHIGDTLETPDEYLPYLSFGDMVTHYQTPKSNGLLNDSGVVLSSALEAKSNGVLFDCGHGRTHFSFDIAERLVAQGLPPDTIGSDLSTRSYPDLKPGLITIMNKWLALGYPVAEVIAATTSGPARAVRHESTFGSLRPALCGDVSVLRWEDGDFRYRDALGSERALTRRLAPWLTVRSGVVVWNAGFAHSEQGATTVETGRYRADTRYRKEVT